MDIMFHSLPATIKDVAALAGVSIGTVSRVLNNYADVDAKLRERVESAIRELSYRPNARARSFVQNSTPILSFILSNRTLINPFHSGILQGVEEYCEQAGYFVMFTQYDYSRQTRPADLQLPGVLRSHGMADCLILAGTNYDNFVISTGDPGSALRGVDESLFHRPRPIRLRPGGVERHVGGLRRDQVPHRVRPSAYLVHRRHVSSLVPSALYGLFSGDDGSWTRASRANGRVG